MQPKKELGQKKISRTHCRETTKMGTGRGYETERIEKSLNEEKWAEAMLKRWKPAVFQNG